MKRTLCFAVGGIAMAGALTFPAVSAASPTVGGAGLSQDWPGYANDGGNGISPIGNGSGFHWWCGGPVRDVIHPVRCLIRGHADN